jgi:hypothetical protein
MTATNYDKLINVANLQDAQCWASTNEKTIWSLNYLQESRVDAAGFSEAQDRLEARFVFLLRWLQVRDVLTPLADLLSDLNAADADGPVNSLPAHWASSRSVYGQVQNALHLAVQDHFGYSLADGDGPNWGDNGEHWSRDLHDWLLALASAPLSPLRD